MTVAAVVESAVVFAVAEVAEAVAAAVGWS